MTRIHITDDGGGGRMLRYSCSTTYIHDSHWIYLAPCDHWVHIMAHHNVHKIRHGRHSQDNVRAIASHLHHKSSNAPYGPRDVAS